MAWTDYSATDSDLWDSAIGSTSASALVCVGIPGTAGSQLVAVSTDFSSGFPGVTTVNSLDNSYNIPGFEDGYYPTGVVSPIKGDLSDGGGGGSTRPATGFLYPRGQG